MNTKVNFSSLGLSRELTLTLDSMSVTTPTEVQRQVIPLTATGKDLIAVAQTGSGKTLAFALSILSQFEKSQTARALVLAPSREMAQQIFKVFERLCADDPISMCLAVGGTPGSKQSSTLKKLPRLIVATPGRMNDHLQSNKLLLQGVNIIVIDEADRMLDMGFSPQLESIQNTLRGRRQTLMFSASFGRGVESVAQIFVTGDPVMVRSGNAEEPVSTLLQTVIFLTQEQKFDRLLDELNATKEGVIVFCGSQESCDTVGNYLKSYGFATDLIHGNLTQGQRNRVVREFREGIIRIVVATDLLARGIDVPHVGLVINFDMPFQNEDFLHRIGRTARAGRDGHAITFVTEADDRMYKRIGKFIEGAKEIVVTADAHRSLDAPVSKKTLRLRTDKYAGLKGSKKDSRPRARL